jgi:ElaB/YqjD/DUF883 family membrane-anchored ribosome-binding protein
MPEKSTYYNAGEPAGLNDKIMDTAAQMKNKVSDTASQMKDKVSDLGRTATQKIDDNREAAASGLDKAASTLHDTADSLPGGEKLTGLAHSTADTLSTTADYVRQHNVNSMMADVETLVKNNPGASLLGAAVIGFLVGRAFSSND